MGDHFILSRPGDASFLTKYTMEFMLLGMVDRRADQAHRQVRPLLHRCGGSVDAGCDAVLPTSDVAGATVHVAQDVPSLPLSMAQGPMRSGPRAGQIFHQTHRRQDVAAA
jgi:hypothetical protein